MLFLRAYRTYLRGTRERYFNTLHYIYSYCTAAIVIKKNATDVPAEASSYKVKTTTVVYPTVLYTTLIVA